MGGSSHLTTNLSSPFLFFSLSPSLLHPNQKDLAVLHRKKVALKVWFVFMDFFLLLFFFFPSLSNEICYKPLLFPFTHNAAELLLQKAERVCVRACNVGLLAPMCCCVGV